MPVNEPFGIWGCLPAPSTLKGAKRWPAARGSPGSLAKVASFNLDVAPRCDGTRQKPTRQIPGQLGTGDTALSLTAYRPLGSAELIPLCFHSL